MKIIRVGRSNTNDVVITDPSVAMENHCQIIQDDYGRFRILDSSENGTFVNGIRISRGCEIPLNEMDTVRIGNTMLPWRRFFSTEVKSYNGGGYNANYNNGCNVNNNGYMPNGGYPNPMPPQQKPDSYLVWAILSLLFCCMPLGIVAVVYASKVDGLWISGNYQEAINAANSAKTWVWWSVGLGLAGYICYIILLIAGYAFV